MPDKFRVGDKTYNIPDDEVLRISPVGVGGQSREIALKKDTNIAIVYIRALSPNKLNYNLVELQ